VLSNLTGAVLGAEQATDPTYWARQLGEPVRFGDCLRVLLAEEPSVVLGADRGGAVTGFARAAARAAVQPPRGLDLLGGRGSATDEEVTNLCSALTAAWTAGVPADLAVPRPAHPAALPTYPFAETPYWIGSPVRPAETPAPMTGAQPVVDDVTATIVGLWHRAFGGPVPHPDDEFFAMGGTSLLAAQLVAVVNEDLLIDLRLHDLYDCPTPARLAARATELLAARDDAELLRLLDEIEAEDGSVQ
jgi:phthiocerol/phenolphthiocerol synthesis type-I polyketide synthase E